MKKIFKIGKVLYFYTILLSSLFLFFKCYEYYFFNELFIKIPNVVDVKYEDAKKIEKKGLKLKIMGEVSSTKAVGLICKQTPYPSSLIKRGSNIKVFISKGIRRIEVPNIIEESLDDAQKILKNRNILIGNIDFVFNENIDFNKIISTDPEEGTLIATNKRIALLVSKGSRNKITFIPDVIGLDFEKVQEIFKIEGLLIGRVSYKKVNYEKNIVLDILPKVGEKVFKGSFVDIVLSE